MSDKYPHVPAAFINNIADEGTKQEAIEWLQRTWNELCFVTAQLSALQGRVEADKALLRRAINNENVRRELGEWWVEDVAKALNDIPLKEQPKRTKRCPHGVHHDNRCKECD